MLFVVVAVATLVSGVLSTGVSAGPVPGSLIGMLVTGLGTALLVRGLWYLHDRPRGQRFREDTELLALARMRAVLDSQDALHKHAEFEGVRIRISEPDTDSARAKSLTVSLGEYLRRSDDQVAPRFTIVMGERGKGKSTLLIRIAKEIVDRRLGSATDSVPIVISLETWTPERKFSSWVEQQMLYTMATPPEITSAWMKASRSVLLVDGYESMLSSENRRKFLGELSSWFNSPGAGRVVMTSTSRLRKELDEYFVQARTVSIDPIDGGIAKSFLKKLMMSAQIVPADLRADASSLLGEMKSITPGYLAALRIALGHDVQDEGLQVLDEEDKSKLLYAERIASQQDRVEDAIEIYRAVAKDAEGLLGAIATTRAELLASIRPYGLARDTRGFEKAIKQMSDLTPLVARPSFPSSMRADESRIFELLSHDRPLFLGEIQFQCRMTPSTTLDALRALVSQGFVSKIEVGAARVPAYQSNVDWIENASS